jgi:hypothetical protein
MPPFKFPVCPHCKKKNEVDLAKLSGSEIGYRSDNEKRVKKREYYFECQHCHELFRLTVDEENSDEGKKG